jgi:hypothetical protein
MASSALAADHICLHGRHVTLKMRESIRGVGEVQCAHKFILKICIDSRLHVGHLACDLLRLSTLEPV